MAKVFDYKLYQGKTEQGEPILVTVTMAYNEKNLQIAEKEAYNGEITQAYDAELRETDTEPTQLDRMEAQLIYTAMMTDTLLGV